MYVGILIFKGKWLDNRGLSKKFVGVVMGRWVALFLLNLGFGETDGRELLRRSFEDKYVVK